MGDSGYAGTRPNEGFMPGMPQKVDGMRTEPAPSVPTAAGPMPDATAAAAPPDDPPGVILGFHGLRVTPVSRLSVVPLIPNSGVFVLPNNTAPASRNRAVTGASISHGCFGSTVREPRNVGQPRVSIRSLIDTGTPSRMPVGAPLCQRASDAFALANACSASTMPVSRQWPGLDVRTRQGRFRPSSAEA